MRVYIPATVPVVADLLSRGCLPPPVEAFAVTASLRSWAQETGPSDDEELELVALSEGARAALRLLAAAPELAGRRVVLAADVPDLSVRVDDEGDLREPGQVTVTQAVALGWVRAAHVDEAAAERDVRAGAEAVVDADAGAPDAEAVVSLLDQCELLWYDADELSTLVQPAR